MDEPNRRVIDRYWPAFDARDAAVMREIAHDDLVTEWPQSGERIVGKENCLIVLRNHPGGGPVRTDRRTLGSGDVWITESILDYPGGHRSHFVSVFELRHGKIAKLTEYFADPFEPPRWRLELVDAGR
jgi:hypothetical protein